MSVSVVDKIVQYQKSIEKHPGNEEKLLYYIKKLSQLPVTVTHLQETGVGRTINSLRKSNGDVRAAAKNLVSKWKDMVAAEEAEEEEEVENRPEEVVSEKKYTSPDINSLKRRLPDNQANLPEKKKRKETSTDNSSHHDSGHSQNSYHHRERGDPSPEKRKHYSSYSVDKSPEAAYENGHHSDSDEEVLRIEDYVKEESQSTSDVEPTEMAQRSFSQDSNYTAQQSSDDESTKKASSSKSHSHKDSKHRESSKHHHDQKEKSSKKDHSSHKIKEEKRDKSEKSHRKHEKHKSRESSKDEEAKKSPKKSHHSSSSSHKSKDKESRSKDSREKTSPVKSASEVKIKQEPVDTYEVKIKQEPIDKPSSFEKTDKTESKKSSSGSSSSKSDKDKDKRRNSDKDRSKEKKSSQKEKMKELEDEGVDSFSGASFGDVLGMIGPTKSSKKKSLSSPSTSKGVAGYDPMRPDLNYEKGRSKVDKDLLDSPSEEEGYNYNSLRPSAIEEDLLLPEISPHYRPLPQPNYSVSPTKKFVSDGEALSHIISSKTMRTKVYSGNKSGYSHVPSLFEICTRVLQDNIEALGPTGGVPFDILRPVLEHATAEQLAVLEHYNPYLIEDTDSIWQYHCEKDFRNKRREEMETWRDMYIRCGEEREQKLKSLTSSIQNSMSKWTPVRKTKLAYVEGTVKPPRGVARKQAKYGSAQPKSSVSTSKSNSISPKPSTSSSSSVTTSTSSFGGRQTVMAAPTVSVPNPRAGSSNSSAGSLKPKPKAPLMQKALQLVRNRYKR